MGRQWGQWCRPGCPPRCGLRLRVHIRGKRLLVLVVYSSRALTFTNVKPRTTNTIMFGVMACGREAAAAAAKRPQRAKRAPAERSEASVHKHITHTKNRNRTHTKNRNRTQTKNRHKTHTQKGHITQHKDGHVTHATNKHIRQRTTNSDNVRTHFGS